MKYAEPVIHSEAFDPIYGRRAEDQIRIGSSSIVVCGAGIAY